jgi:hypothetical protein
MNGAPEVVVGFYVWATRRFRANDPPLTQRLWSLTGEQLGAMMTRTQQATVCRCCGPLLLFSSCFLGPQKSYL